MTFGKAVLVVTLATLLAGGATACGRVRQAAGPSAEPVPVQPTSMPATDTSLPVEPTYTPALPQPTNTLVVKATPTTASQAQPASVAPPATPADAPTPQPAATSAPADTSKQGDDLERQVDQLLDSLDKADTVNDVGR